MESTRQKKISRLIQKELSEILRLETVESYRNSLISVTVVRISPDMGHARVYLSIFPSEKATEITAALNEISKQIKHKLAINVKTQLRKVPELVFFIDDSLDFVENIDRLLNNK